MKRGKQNWQEITGIMAKMGKTKKQKKESGAAGVVKNFKLS